MYVRMYVCNVCVYVCMYACMCACMCVCMHACMCVCVCVLVCVYFVNGFVVASQISNLELQSEQIYSEGLSSLRSEGAGGGGASADGGVGPDSGDGSPNSGEREAGDDIATLWECYFKWALERHEQTTAFKSLKKKVFPTLNPPFPSRKPQVVLFGMKSSCIVDLGYVTQSFLGVASVILV